MSIFGCPILASAVYLTPQVDEGVHDDTVPVRPNILLEIVPKVILKRLNIAEMQFFAKSRLKYATA